MNLIVLLIAVTISEAASIGNSNISFAEGYYDDDRSIDLQDTRIQMSASLSDVHYYVYRLNSRNNPHVIGNNDVSGLAAANFDPKKRVVFIIHGWNNDHSSNVNSLIKDALFAVADMNVIIVDWGTVANKNYLTAKTSVKTIGEFVGAFINAISQKYNKSYKDFVLVGHSLGAHIAGCAGAITAQKVDYIVGLDPALPLFTTLITDDRLDTTDADFVQIIHTCGGLLGFLKAIGHADYYPNGGEVQPGCGLDIEGKCAHSRSYMYFAESIKHGQFRAYKCGSYLDFKIGKCKSDESDMGGLNVNKNARGTYYLQTNPEEPFARG